ncbi:MAG: hypothetical protein V8R91_05285 [Butyricimonas faecihominis]
MDSDDRGEMVFTEYDKRHLFDFAHELKVEGGLLILFLPSGMGYSYSGGLREYDGSYVPGLFYFLFKIEDY